VDGECEFLKKVHCDVRGHDCAAQLRAKRKGNAGGDERHGRTEGHKLSSLVAKLRHCRAVLSLEWHVARWCNSGSRVGEGTREETVGESGNNDGSGAHPQIGSCSSARCQRKTTLAWGLTLGPARALPRPPRHRWHRTSLPVARGGKMEKSRV
jgi:hypothetical protein